MDIYHGNILPQLITGRNTLGSHDLSFGHERTSIITSISTTQDVCNMNQHASDASPHSSMSAMTCFPEVKRQKNTHADQLSVKRNPFHLRVMQFESNTLPHISLKYEPKDT